MSMTVLGPNHRQYVLKTMARAFIGLLRSLVGLTRAITSYIGRTAARDQIGVATGCVQIVPGQNFLADRMSPLAADAPNRLGDWSPSRWRNSHSAGGLALLPNMKLGPETEPKRLSYDPNPLFPMDRPLEIEILEDDHCSDRSLFSSDESFSFQQVIADVVEDTTGFRILPAREGILYGLTRIEFRYELARRQRKSVESLRRIQSDLELALGRSPVHVVFDHDIRVIVPLQSREREFVLIRRLIEEAEIPEDGSVTGLLGRTNSGHPFALDFRQDPHCLFAGATGSGKSVALMSLVFGLVFRYSPDQVRLVIADHKCELTLFRGLPHLWCDIVITKADYQRLLLDLQDELKRRKSIKDPADRARLPLLAVIIDEFHGFGCSDQLMSLVAEARSFRIHFVLATQHPTADVISTTVKANLVTRIAFRVANESASRLVLDEPGASKLLGKGDCLARTVDGVYRIQAAWVTTDERGDDSDIIRLQKYLHDGPRQEVGNAD